MQKSLGLVMMAVIGCGHSPNVPGDGSMMAGSDGPPMGSDGAVPMDYPDPPDPPVTPCAGKLGFPSVPGVPDSSLTLDRVADVDADGVADLIMISSNNLVRVAHGHGDGTFDPGVDYPVGTNPYDAVVLDVTGDGKPDIVTINFQSASVSVLVNLGTSFAPQVSYPSGQAANMIASADLTGDGKPDLVVAADREVRILRNLGLGSFAAPELYPIDPTQWSLWALAVGDVTGDGKPDVVAVSGTISSSALVFVNTGSGALAAPVAYPTGNPPRHVALGDVTGDGKLDIVAATTNNTLGKQGLTVLANLGTGTFGAPVESIVGSYQGKPFALGDLDGDGRLDAAVIGTDLDAPDTVGVAYGQASGGFATSVPYSTSLVRNVAMSDLNGDGKLDLVVTTGAGTDAMLNHGDGTFRQFRELPWTDWSRVVATADFNHDGKSDIVVAGFEGSGGVYLAQASGFSALATEPGVAYPSLAGPLIADIDGDHVIDVVILDQYAMPAAVWLGNDDGTFTGSSVTMPQGADAAVLVDLDHDGKRELVSVQRESLMVAKYQAGGFTTVGSVTLPHDETLGIAAGDVDGDGNQDLVVAQLGGGATYLGDGHGNLASPIGVTLHVGPLGLGDMNGDGKLDLVDSEEVVLGNGDGTFGPALLADGGYGAMYVRKVSVRDIDGDGHLDVVTSGPDMSFVGLGNGDGTVRGNWYFGGRPLSGAVGDFEGDGRPDLVTALDGVPTHYGVRVLPGTCTP